jgi:hypothetical protein
MVKVSNVSSQELPLEFMGKGEVKSMFFTQLRGSDKGFLYSVMNMGSVHYEVFERKVNSQYGGVSYPRSKSFGKWAWSYYSLDRALLKFTSL